jgi:hypothetical protein
MIIRRLLLYQEFSRLGNIYNSDFNYDIITNTSARQPNSSTLLFRAYVGLGPIHIRATMNSRLCWNSSVPSTLTIMFTARFAQEKVHFDVGTTIFPDSECTHSADQALMWSKTEYGRVV